MGLTSSLKPAAKPAGIAGLSVRDRETRRLQVGGCSVSIVLVLGIASAASAVTLTDVTLFTATGTTQAEDVIGGRVISHPLLRAS